MSSASNSAIILGKQISNAEFQILLEFCKATFFGAAGTMIAFYFNLRAKAREQDGVLFNEYIKEKIKCLHEVNKRLIDLLQEYLILLDRNRVETSDLLFSKLDGMLCIKSEVNELSISQKFSEGISNFIEALPKRLNEILVSVELQRYLLGERNIRNIQTRIQSIHSVISDVWSFDNRISVPKILGLYSKLIEFKSSSDAMQDVAKLLIYNHELHSKLSKKLLLRELDRLHDSFEDVVKSKGSRETSLFKTSVRSAPRIISPFQENKRSIKEGTGQLEHQSVEQLAREFKLWQSASHH